MARDYRKEYDRYHGTEEQKKNRAKRNNARRKMMREGRVSKGDGMDVDHKRGIAAGNGKENLRVQTKSANRSFPRDKNARKK
jgi:hypothetical protein